MSRMSLYPQLDPSRIVLALAVGLFLSEIPLRAQDANGGRPDLLPREVRWRTFPVDVKRVTVDARGRPWFETEGLVARDALKRQVEIACELPAPWVKGARVLRLDRQGRVWLRPNDDWTLLLGYDPRTRAWAERRVVPESERAGHQEKRPDSGQVVFLDSTYESKAGRLYFADRLGVHVLDAGKWSYQLLYRLNLERDLYYDTIRSFDEPHFAEEDERVFVWTRWGRCGWTGTVGFFLHDGKTWTHRLLQEPPLKGGPAGDARSRDNPEKPDHNRIHSLIPLTGDRVVVCTESGTAYVTSVKGDRLGDDAVRQIEKDITLLGDDAFAIRRAAHERLAGHGPPALPLLRNALKKHRDLEIVTRLKDLIEQAELALRRPDVDGHQFLYTRAHGVDTRGRTWLWFDRCRTPDSREERGGFRLISREGKVLPAPAGTSGWYPDSMFADRRGRVYFARYERGCVAFEGDRVLPITDPTQTALRYVLGEDAGGRIYLTDERRVYAYLPGAPDERAALPTTIYEVPRNENDVVQDSLGRAWALLLPPGQQRPAMLSVFEKGAWREAALPGGKAAASRLAFFMPLKEGCLVAKDSESRRAFFHDGDAWHEYAGLRELVEKRHTQLVQLIDNRQWGRGQYAKLRVDAAGRIWLAESEGSGVWDGRQWIDPARPLNGGARGPFDRCDFLLPLPGGKAMLATAGGAHALAIDGGRLKEVPYSLPGAGRINNDYTTRSGVWVGRDRIWLPRNNHSCVVIDGDGPRELADTGYPRFLDSRGWIWFHNPSRRKLVALDPRGQRATLTDEALGIDAVPITEDRSGSLWVGTDRGLLNVCVKADETGPVAERGKLSEKDVPRGSCLMMCVDPEDNLWCYGPGPQHNYRLYRVRLPSSGVKH